MLGNEDANEHLASENFINVLTKKSQNSEQILTRQDSNIDYFVQGSLMY